MRTNNYGHIGLGYVAKTARVLKTDGAKYDHLFVGKYQGKRTLVNPNASTFDTLQLINKVTEETYHQVAPLAKFLTGSNVEQTIRNNWNFVYNYIDYVEDKDEEIQEPLAMWHRKKGDCDCYTTFLSCLLINQGIPHYSDTVKMYGRSNFQHIFIIVPKNPATFNPEADKNNKSKYWVLDCVVDNFDYEPEKITFKYLTKMGTPLYRLSGTGKEKNTNNENSNQVVLTFGREFEDIGSSLMYYKPQLQGLGCLDKSRTQAMIIKNEFMARLKVHLQNTRTKYAQANNIPSKATILADLDNIIANWDDNSMRKSALNGTTIKGLAGWGENWQKFKDNVKNVVDEVGDAVKKGAEAVKDKAKDLGEFLVKINPLGVATREIIFNFYRNDVGGSASKLKWAYADNNTFLLSGKPISEKAKYTSVLENITRIIKAAGGTETELKSAVLRGSSLPTYQPSNSSLSLTEDEKNEVNTGFVQALNNEVINSNKEANAAYTVVVDTSGGTIVENGKGNGIPTTTYTTVADGNNNTQNKLTPLPVVPVASSPIPTGGNVWQVTTNQPVILSATPVSSSIPNATVANVNNSGYSWNINTPTPTVSGLSGLSGVDDMVKNIISKMLEFLKELGESALHFLKNFRDGVIQFIKVSALAGPRALFLMILKLNIDGISTALGVNGAQKMEDNWVSRFGGERSAFKNALSIGQSKSPKKLGLLGSLVNYLTKGSLSGIEEPLNETIVPGTEVLKDNDTNYDELIKTGVDTAAMAAANAGDKTKLQAVLVGVFTAVGAAVGAACGGVGVIVGAPAGAVVGSLVYQALPDSKKTTQENTTTTNSDGSNDGEIKPPAPVKKSSGGIIALAAFSLIAIAATPTKKPKAAEKKEPENLSGTKKERIAEITI